MDSKNTTTKKKKGKEREEIINTGTKKRPSLSVTILNISGSRPQGNIILQVYFLEYVFN